ncbi:hypothetical protein [Streptomyces filamentosus]|uniref:hypothetical protein n=1 Tax=Streptomyces filamentosus TaxID=67294 RepID=UPI00340F8535
MPDEEMVDPAAQQADTRVHYAEYQAALERAQQCRTLEDLSWITQTCLWMLTQQNALMKTAILSYFNDGQLPAPTFPIQRAEAFLATKQEEWVDKAGRGEGARTFEDILVDELAQALRLAPVQHHAHMSLISLLEARQEEIAELLRERIVNLPKYPGPTIDGP